MTSALSPERERELDVGRRVCWLLHGAEASLGIPPDEGPTLNARLDLVLRRANANPTRITEATYSAMYRLRQAKPAQNSQEMPVTG